MDDATLMSCMDAMMLPTEELKMTDLEYSPSDAQPVALCDCDDGPNEVLDCHSNLRICRNCGKVLSSVAVDVDPTAAMKWRPDGVRYSCSTHNDSQRGTRISYGPLNRIQKWTTDKSRLPLYGKLDNIRQACGRAEFSTGSPDGGLPQNVVNTACNIFKILDRYLRTKNEIHRAGRLIGLQAACVKQAVQDCLWLCADDEIMRMFFLRQTRSKRTNEHDTIILEQTRQYMTFGMEHLFKALEHEKRCNGETNKTKRLTTAEVRIKNVRAFIEQGCKKLGVDNIIKQVAIHLAKRINEQYLSHIIQSRQHETIYITCIVMANERYGSNTTNSILNALGSTSSTVTKLKNEIRKYLERKFQVKRTRMSRCNAKDTIFDSLFPSKQDLDDWL